MPLITKLSLCVNFSKWYHSRKINVISVTCINFTINLDKYWWIICIYVCNYNIAYFKIYFKFRVHICFWGTLINFLVEECFGNRIRLKFQADQRMVQLTDSLPQRKILHGEKLHMRFHYTRGSQDCKIFNLHPSTRFSYPKYLVNIYSAWTIMIDAKKTLLFSNRFFKGG